MCPIRVMSWITSSGVRVSPRLNCAARKLFARIVLVPAGVGPGAGADLRDPEVEDVVAELRRLAGRQDHARVGDGEAEDRHELLEVVIAHRVRRRDGGRGVHGGLEPRDGDRVGADAAVLLELQGVEEEPQDFVPVVVQPEEGADAHVVDPRPPAPGASPSTRQAKSAFGPLGCICR